MSIIEALRTLVDNSLQNESLNVILEELFEQDEFEDDDDKLCCIAYYGQDGSDDPDGYTYLYDNTIDTPNGEFLVLDDDEADTACREYIEETLWAFNPSFLSGETGIDETVFEALADKCEGANDAIRSIITGSCGIDSFIESAISADGRGHFLAPYDDEEIEVSVGSVTYYLYRVN